MMQNIAPTNTNATFTGLVAGPSTGKSTLLLGLQKAAMFVRGFLFADMSNIMDWHRDPDNQSPFRALLKTAKEKQQSSGGLVDDSLTTNALFYFFNKMQVEAEKEIDGGIRKILLSGYPRTEQQRHILLSYFTKVRCGFIDCSREVAEENRQKRISVGIKRDDDLPEVFNKRWDIFEQRTYPQVILPLEASCTTDEFVRIDFNLSPREKALKILRVMEVSPIEFSSMRNQITNPNCEACQHFDSVKKLARSTRPPTQLVKFIPITSIPHIIPQQRAAM